MSTQQQNTSFDIFSDQLRSAMESKGWNQQDLAAATGIAQGAISNYIRAKREPTAAQLHRLSSALGVGMERLLTGQGPAPPGSAPSGAGTLRSIRAEAEKLARQLGEAEVTLARLRSFLG